MVDPFDVLGYAGVLAWSFNDRAFLWAGNNRNV
jgi:hypothetical protein